MRNLLLVALTAAAATAQIPLVAPVGFATAEGNSDNAFPWNWASSAIRTQFIYDSSNFTQQGVNGPVTIVRLRFRPNAGTGSFTGGTFPTAVIQMSTCPVDYLAVSGAWGSNHGPDLTTVVNGPVTVQAGTRISPGPVPWHIDIPLSTPFVYDPSTGGDLTVDIQLPPLPGSGLVQADHNQGVGVTRVYDTTGVNPVGTVGTNYGAVCEFSYLGAGFASAVPYGSGCPAASAVVVYEQFAGNSFDLANSNLLFVPAGNGSYLVLPGGSAWFSGFSNNLNLGNDAVASVPLPVAFPHASGTATSLHVSSNGFVWLGSSSNAEPSPTVSSFLSGLPRIACAWTDLDPTSGGAVYADNNAAGGEFVVTWSQVAEAGTPGNRTSMQLALQPGGLFELRYQGVAIASHTALTGYSMGGTGIDPGPADLSSVTTQPIQTGIAAMPLRLSASARPVLGTSFQLQTGNLATGTPVGVTLLGFGQLNPGLDLGPLGAPGCQQYVAGGVSLVFLVSGPTASLPVAVPSLTTLAGLHVFGQSAAFSGGFNPLGVVFSNGLDLKIDGM